MAINFPPQAEKGKSIKSAWDELVAWAKSAKIHSGPGVRLAHSAEGTTISFYGKRQSFSGAFPVSLSGDRVQVGMGTVSGIEPTINGIPITGDKDGVIPTLKLDPDKYNSEGKTWVCVQAEIEEESNRIDPEKRDVVTIIQQDSPMRAKENTATAPLAMLARRDPENTDDIGTLYQIAYFNLKVYAGHGRRLLAP